MAFFLGAIQRNRLLLGAIPAIRYIFFVIANEVKQSVGYPAIAIAKKDAASIGARAFVIQTNLDNL